MCSAAPGHRLRPRPQHTQGWWAPPCGPSAGSPCLACLEAGSCVPGSGSRGGAGGAGSRRRPHLMSGARGIRWKILLGRVGGRSIREGAVPVPREVQSWPLCLGGASLVAQTVKTLPAMQETRVPSLSWEDPSEKEMAIHSRILAGESHRQRSLTGCSPWGCRAGND